MLHVFLVCSPLWRYNLTTSSCIMMNEESPSAFAFLTPSLPLVVLAHAKISYKRPDSNRCTIFQEDCNCQNWFKNQNRKLTNNKKPWKLKVVLVLKHLFKVFCCKTKPIRFWHKCNFSTKEMPKGGFSVWDCHLVVSAVGQANKSGKAG